MTKSKTPSAGEARVWRILQGRKESFIQEMIFAALVGKEINESMVEEIDRAISVASYDSLLSQAEKLAEALAFYAQPHVWGVAFPGEHTSIESLDEWEFQQPNGEMSKRGGKTARQALAEFQKWKDKA